MEALLEDVKRLRGYLDQIADAESESSGQAQLVKTILTREEQLSELRAKQRTVDAERERKEQALVAALTLETAAGG